LVRSYPLALMCLFMAGFFELSFSSMTQTIVQLNAPAEIRGRVLGLFNMSSGGLRAFSGITVGLLGSIITVHFSLALAAAAFMAITLVLLARMPKPVPLPKARATSLRRRRRSPSARKNP
jgi:MFS family permease